MVLIYLVHSQLKCTIYLKLFSGIVPLLSLLSRVANGGDSFGAKGDDASCREFKEIFKRFWKSPVINVRRLAAKAFANFTARSAHF